MNAQLDAIRKATQALVKRWDTPNWTSPEGKIHTSELIRDLARAVAAIPPEAVVNESLTTEPPMNATTNAAELPALTDEECDKIAAQTMDQVAAAKGLEHAVYLVTDIAHSHTLRRELIRSGARAALSTQSQQEPVVLMLTELMRGLEIPPAGPWTPQALFCIGQAIATQAKQAAQPAAVVPDGWLPIETAPKDGTEVLLLVPHRIRAGQMLRLTGRWFDRFWITFNADEAIQRVEPTHWIPLPEGPESGLASTQAVGEVGK